MQKQCDTGRGSAGGHGSSGTCDLSGFVSKLQKTEPKLASRQLPDGTMVSASLEDMYPFLSREEMEEEGVLWKE